MTTQLVHFELPLADAERGRAFFGGLLGWSFSDWQGSGYLMIDGAAPSGALSAGDAGPAVLYFGTDDIDGAVARVRELGGTTDGAQAIPDVGRFAVCKDDQGTGFGLFQPGG
jgi:predicted enzyme related to lactoylglutathione lyase